MLLYYIYFCSANKRKTVPKTTVLAVFAVKTGKIRQKYRFLWKFNFMQKSRINAKYLHKLSVLCKFLWININIWHCLFLLSRSETEFSKHFQKLPRKITPDLAGYGKNFAIGSSRQSIPSQNKPTPPPSSKRPKKQTARPHKKIRVTGTSRENRAFCGGKITKNSRSSAQTASETVAPPKADVRYPAYARSRQPG